MRSENDAAIAFGEKKRGNCIIAGIIATLLFWQFLSMVLHKAIVASPMETLTALIPLVRDGILFTELLITLRRLMISLLLGSLIGLSTGVTAGLSPKIRAFFEPIRWIGMTIPAIVIAVLAMLWFGMGDKQTIFLVTMIITPIMYVNTVEGITAIDKKLLEMGRVYHFPWILVLKSIYLPGIAPYILAGATLAAGIGVRAVVLAELMGAFEGVGHSFSRAWMYLNTPELFAWILSCLLLMAFLEFGILLPIRKRLLRWKKGKN